MCEAGSDFTREMTSVRIDVTMKATGKFVIVPPVTVGDIQGVSYDSLFGVGLEACDRNSTHEVCDMYVLDSDRTQAKVSVLVDMTIRSAGLSFG